VRISPSSYKTFIACPRKWWFEKVVDAPKDFDNRTHLLVGTLLHALAERFLDDEVEGEDALRDALPNLDIPADQVEAIAKVAMAAFKAGRDMLVRLKARKDSATTTSGVGSFIVESAVQGHAGDLPFLGYVDIFDWTGDVPIVEDHKTSSSPNGKYTHQSPQAAAEDPQLGFYAYCLVYKDTDYNGPCYVRHLYYPTKGGAARQGPIGKLTRADAEAHFDRYKAIATRMVETARIAPTIEDQDKVDAKSSACYMFGGCQFASTCHFKTPRGARTTKEVVNMSTLKERMIVTAIKTAIAKAAGNMDAAIEAVGAVLAKHPDFPNADALAEAELTAAFEPAAAPAPAAPAPAAPAPAAPAAAPTIVAPTVVANVNPPDARPLVTPEMQAAIAALLMDVAVSLDSFTPAQVHVVKEIVAARKAESKEQMAAVISGEAVPAPVAVPETPVAAAVPANAPAEDTTLESAAAVIMQEFGGKTVDTTSKEWINGVRAALKMQRATTPARERLEKYMLSAGLIATTTGNNIIVYRTTPEGVKLSPAQVVPMNDTTPVDASQLRPGPVAVAAAPVAAPVTAPTGLRSIVLYGAVATNCPAIAFEDWLAYAGVHDEYRRVVESPSNKGNDAYRIPYQATGYGRGRDLMVQLALDAWMSHETQRPGVMVIPREHPLGGAFFAQLTSDSAFTIVGC